MGNRSESESDPFPMALGDPWVESWTGLAKCKLDGGVITCYHLLRAVRIRAALLMRMEVESERAESEGWSRTWEWVSDGEHVEG